MSFFRRICFFSIFAFLAFLAFFYTKPNSYFWNSRENCDGDCRPFIEVVEYEVRKLGVQVRDLNSITFPIPVFKNRKFFVINNIDKCKIHCKNFRFLGEHTEVSYTEYFFEKGSELPKKKIRHVLILNSEGDLRKFAEFEYKNIDEVKYRKICHKFIKNGDIVGLPEKRFVLKICENQDRIFEFAVFYDADSFFPRTQLIPLDLSAVIFGPDLL